MSIKDLSLSELKILKQELLREKLWSLARIVSAYLKLHDRS